MCIHIRLYSIVSYCISIYIYVYIHIFVYFHFEITHWSHWQKHPMEFSYNHTTLTVPKPSFYSYVALIPTIHITFISTGGHIQPPPPGFESWAPNEWYLTWKFGGHSRSLGVFSSQGFSKLVGGSSTTPPNFKAMIILESNKKVARKKRKRYFIEGINEKFK